jgi:phosphopentomutase
LKTHRRAIVIVLDSLGIGALPDAADYGDEGTHTLGHISQTVKGFSLPHLAEMGLGNLGAFPGVPPLQKPSACFGRMAEVSTGKDTSTGHWELMGLITRTPFPTYPDGFPPVIIQTFEKAIGRKSLGNVPASGTEIIQRLGDEHRRTGSPIVYTSADSVFQIAAHEEVIPVEELYEICKRAREILTPPHGVGRVIARPFVGTGGHYTRTYRRHDFSLPPHGKTLLNVLQENGLEVAGIGKIGDIFAGSGLTRLFPARNNQEGVDRTLEAMGMIKAGMILTNLVEFDMLFGHRNNPQGYGEALMAFDHRIPELLKAMQPEDLLVITADHGCDPTTPGTDHTREYVPLLMQGKRISPGTAVGSRASMADLAKTLQEFFRIEAALDGKSFWRQIYTR